MVSTKIVGDNQAFITLTGERLYSLKQLVSYMRRMDATEFAHHANKERNDFANWISAVFKEKALAKKLSTSQFDTLAVLTRAVTTSTKKVTPVKKVSSPKKRTTKKAVSQPKKTVQVVSHKSEKRTQSKPVGKVKQLGMFEKNPHVTTEEEELEAKRLTIHEQIEHLENQTKHLTKYHKNTNRSPISNKDVDLKEHLVDFTLGLIIGIVLGFILVRSLGLFA